MLLLRDVHFVLPWGECREASIVDDGAELDTVNLLVWYAPWDIFDAPEAVLPLDVRGARYDAAGKPGTWHTVADCPCRATRS